MESTNLLRLFVLVTTLQITPLLESTVSTLHVAYGFPPKASFTAETVKEDRQVHPP